MKSLHSDRSDLSDRRSEYGLRDDDRARRPLSFTSAAILIEKHRIENLRGGGRYPKLEDFRTRHVRLLHAFREYRWREYRDQ